MWGAIIGDIVGPRFEGTGIKGKEFELLTRDCRFADNTVCTAAVAASLHGGVPPDLTLREWCHRHPGRGYGGMFARWLEREAPQAYGSFGNGAAMRVSPAAFLNRQQPVEEVLKAAGDVTRVTHNHPEGMKGARATVHAIWLAFQGAGATQIRRIVEHAYGAPRRSRRACAI